MNQTLLYTGTLRAAPMQVREYEFGSAVPSMITVPTDEFTAWYKLDYVRGNAKTNQGEAVYSLFSITPPEVKNANA